MIKISVENQQIDNSDIASICKLILNKVYPNQTFNKSLFNKNMITAEKKK